MPSSPMMSPAIWNPVTWIRPLRDTTKLLRLPTWHDVERPERLAGRTQGLASARHAGANMWCGCMQDDIGMQGTRRCLFDAIAE